MILGYVMVDPPFGGVILKHEGTDLSARWVHISIPEFADFLKEVARTIADVGRIGYEFAGTDATLDFLYQNGDVTISASYNSGAIIHVSYVELLAAIDEFYRSVDIACSTD
jgi:hypothetical protein